MYTFHQLFKQSRQTVRRGAPLLGLLIVLQAAPLLGQQFGSTVQYFALVALNDGSTTSFTINNPSTTETITVDAQLYFPDGTPLADGQVQLAPEATETLSFGDAGANLTPGWAELKSDSEFIATEFFQLSIAGELKPRVGVLPSVESDEIRFLGFVNPQFTSGLAVSNPSSTEATEITIRVKDKAGQEPVGEKTLTLAPLECITGFLNEVLFFGAAVTNYEGVVEISANSPGVAALSLIQAPNGDVATVSVEASSHYWSETTSGSPNVLAGESSNFVTEGVQGATIGGGGNGPNRITDDFGTVGGGATNAAGDDEGTTTDAAYATVGGGTLNKARGRESTVGGGSFNVASGFRSVVGGGGNNTASGDTSTVAGGTVNEASASSSTVGGGLENTASSFWATVSGGRANKAGGRYSVVPGGSENEARGQYSFAAGRRAKALCQGCFAWADSTEADLTAMTADEFLVRAKGGTTIYSDGDASLGVTLVPGESSWSSLSDRSVKENFRPVDELSLLEQLSRIRITTWNYKAQGSRIRHIGPTAQDFAAAFQVGGSERLIATIDADGVSLAAIQGLYQMLQDKQAQIAQLAKQNNRLAERLAAIGGIGRFKLASPADGWDICSPRTCPKNTCFSSS